MAGEVKDTPAPAQTGVEAEKTPKGPADAGKAINESEEEAPKVNRFLKVPSYMI